MTKEELIQQENDTFWNVCLSIELLAKYVDEDLQDYIAKVSFHIATEGSLLEDGIDLEELKVHRRICEEELQRRESE